MPTLLQIDTTSDSSGPEGDAGSVIRTFEIVRSDDLSGTTTVDWKVVPPNFAPAADAADFLGGVFPSGHVTFAPGETRKTITVSVAGDTAPEGSDGFRVVLSNPVGATVGLSEGFGTIDNDDGPPPVFAIERPPTAVTETDSGSVSYVFHVTRTGGLEPASLTYAVTGDGMAQADGQDFVGGVLPTGRVDFAAGETSKDIVINIAGDRTVEENEGFAVTISPVSTAAVSPQIDRGYESQTGLIVSDDFRPTLALSGSPIFIWEGQDGVTAVTYTISRTGELDPGTVDWAVSEPRGGGASVSGSDFQGGQLPSGRVSFAAGQREQQIVIYVAGDRDFEASEGYTLTLSNPSDGAALVVAYVSGSVLNDDGPPRVAITANQAEQDEGQSGFTPFSFTVSRTGDTAIPSSVDWEIVWPATTISQDDLQPGSATSGRVVFAAGETTKVITLNVVADTAVELDETIVLAFTNPSAPTVISSTFVQTIIIDDDIPAPGGAGSDSLSDVGGDDAIFGGPGADTISGANGGHNYLRGDEGDDSIIGGRDFDDINGNMGDDTAAGGLGDDWVVGGKDQDLLFGDQGNDVVFGNLGHDTCYGGDGNDLIRGGQHDDVLRGEAGNDWLSGDRGDDTVTGGAGADVFHGFGDAGLDRIVDFNRAEGDRIELDLGSTYTVSQSGADTVISIAGGSQMVLLGVQMSSLTPGWITIV